MSKSTDASLREVSTSRQRIGYRAPIKFGGRVVVDVVLFDVEVELESRDGRRGRGRGSMPMGNAWAWPSRLIDTERTLAAMLEFAQQCADRAGSTGRQVIRWRSPMRWRASMTRLRRTFSNGWGWRRPSPDSRNWWLPVPSKRPFTTPTAGRWEQNAYNLLSSQYVNRDLSAYLSDEFAGEFLDRYTLRQPKARMPLYHLVGALDPLTAADVSTRINDGLPETLGEWILAERPDASEDQVGRR